MIGKIMIAKFMMTAKCNLHQLKTLTTSQLLMSSTKLQYKNETLILSNLPK